MEKIIDKNNNNYLARALPTWLCNLCGAEFKFIACTALDKKIEKEEPKFCPYCGRENEILAERRTSFKKIGILDTEDNPNKEEEKNEQSKGGVCV